MKSEKLAVWIFYTIFLSAVCILLYPIPVCYVYILFLSAVCIFLYPIPVCCIYIVYPIPICHVYIVYPIPICQEYIVYPIPICLVYTVYPIPICCVHIVYSIPICYVYIVYPIPICCVYIVYHIPICCVYIFILCIFLYPVPICCVYIFIPFSYLLCVYFYTLFLSAVCIFFIPYSYQQHGRGFLVWFPFNLETFSRGPKHQGSTCTLVSRTKNINRLLPHHLSFKQHSPKLFTTILINIKIMFPLCQQLSWQIVASSNIIQHKGNTSEWATDLFCCTFVPL